MKNLIFNIFTGSMLIAGFSCSTGKVTEEIILSGNQDNPAIEYIAVSNEQFAGEQMTLSRISAQPFLKTIFANGLLDVPPEQKASVSPYFGGYIKEMNLLPGQKVKQGEVLFKLENPEYIEVQREYLEVKGQLSFLKDDYQRQEALIEENITSKKNLLKSKADYELSVARFAGLEKKLKLMKIDPKTLHPGSITSSISVRSPIDGYVVSVNGVRGQYLNPADVVATITNTNHVHVELQVFEKDLSNIREGQKLFFKLQNDEKKYQATVYLTGRSLDPEKRTAMVHCHPDELIESFVPGMYVEAEIFTYMEEMPALPEEAVVSIDNHSFVLIKKSVESGEIAFEKKLVVAGTNSDGYISILNSADFSSDDEFLVKGAFNLITE